MAIIKSGDSSKVLTIDPTSLAARVTLYTSGNIETSLQNKATYSAASTFTPPATPTDMITISGSDTKIVRVLSFIITTTNTGASSQQFFLIYRRTPNAGGTFVGATEVPHDSNDPVATAIVGHYTANPTTLGSSYGTINIGNVSSPVATPATWAGRSYDAQREMLPLIGDRPKPMTLIGSTDLLSLNFAGIALVAGQTHTYRVVWTEE